MLAIILLGVGLCLVPALGYGEINREILEIKVSFMKYYLSDAKVNYLMCNPTSFLIVDFVYDLRDTFADSFPRRVVTKGKIYVVVVDNRGVYRHKTGVALLEEFKGDLETIYSYIRLAATDINTDIVAKWCTKADITLGSFYQGQYHLWER